MRQEGAKGSVEEKMIGLQIGQEDGSGRCWGWSETA